MTTNGVVAVVLGIIAVALIVAALVIAATGHRVPRDVEEVLLVIVGGLLAIAGVAITGKGKAS
jgi:hypothetical protein